MCKLEWAAPCRPWINDGVGGFPLTNVDLSFPLRKTQFASEFLANETFLDNDLRVGVNALSDLLEVRSSCCILAENPPFP